MYCRKCGASIQDDANFCHKCGVSVEAAPNDTEKHCWKCGARLQHDAEFCPNCSVAVPQWDDTHCQKCGALLADEAKFCHVCGTSVIQRICCEPGTREKSTNQGEHENTANYSEVQASDASNNKSKEDTPSEAGNAQGKKSKGELSELFHIIDGKSLGHVVWIFPLRLILLYIVVVFCFAAFFSVIPLHHIRVEELLLFIFIVTFGIVYPCAIMTTAIKSKEYNMWKFLAKAAAICIAVFFALLIIVGINIAEVNYLYGLLYLAAALVAIKKVAGVSAN